MTDSATQFPEDEGPDGKWTRSDSGVRADQPGNAIDAAVAALAELEVVLHAAAPLITADFLLAEADRVAPSIARVIRADERQRIIDRLRRLELLWSARGWLRAAAETVERHPDSGGAETAQDATDHAGKPFGDAYD